jgi:hypothetical protein
MGAAWGRAPEGGNMFGQHTWTRLIDALTLEEFERLEGATAVRRRREDAAAVAVLPPLTPEERALRAVPAIVAYRARVGCSLTQAKLKVEAAGRD